MSVSRMLEPMTMLVLGVCCFLVSLPAAEAFGTLSSQHVRSFHGHGLHHAPSKSSRPQGRVQSRSALSMSLTLYGSQGSRSPLVNWGAYELGLDLTMARNLGENPHPFGQIPCLVDTTSGATLFESGACLNYLESVANVHGATSKERGAILSWIAWANASLDPICFLETPDGKVYDTGLKKPNKRIDALDRILGERDYLLGESFSTADVAVASYLLYVPQFFRGIDLSRWQNIVSYMKRCAARDCYGQAFGPDVQTSLVNALSAMEQKKNDGGNNNNEKKLFGMF
jgi:glutathione S-transferase